MDADNRLLWRMNRSRLDAEQVRDAVLLVSGRLDPTPCGPSDQQFAMKPGIHVTPLVDYAAFDWDRPKGHRRSVYRFIFRTVPDPFREGREIIVTVQKQGGRYVGERDSLITKCPSKFTTAPPAEKQNYWR